MTKTVLMAATLALEMYDDTKALKYISNGLDHTMEALRDALVAERAADALRVARHRARKGKMVR